MDYRLIVMRHAKSDWESGAQTDHDRPLNGRGRRDAPRVARRLVKLGWIPDYVTSSDSQRTRETWDLMEPEFREIEGHDFCRALYHAGPAELMERLAVLTGDVQTVLALGHNPGWQAAVEFLSGERIQMTTANAALLQIGAADWRAAAGDAGGWKLVDVVRPKEL